MLYNPSSHKDLEPSDTIMVQGRPRDDNTVNADSPRDVQVLRARDARGLHV